MRRDPIKKIASVIKSAKKIVIITHWSPDGDAIGSSLGLYHFLKSLKKKVDVIVPNAYPSFLQWMPGNKFILVHEVDKVKTEKLVFAADIVFTLDFNSLARIEELGKVVAASEAKKIMVDHHAQPSDYADLYFHDIKACSTCELVYELIVGLGSKKVITKNIASCLYTGIMTDTGGFRFPSTTSKTHHIVADLIDAGAKNATIYDAVYDENSKERIKLLGYCLEKMIVHPESSMAYITLSEDDHQRYNFQKGDTEGVVNYALSIKGIRFSAFFAERDGMVKISFRSKGDFDVNLFARKHFNGGGHKNAAGGKSDLSLNETIKKFLAIIPDFQKELSN